MMNASRQPYCNHCLFQIHSHIFKMFTIPITMVHQPCKPLISQCTGICLGSENILQIKTAVNLCCMHTKQCREFKRWYREKALKHCSSQISGIRWNTYTANYYNIDQHIIPLMIRSNTKDKQYCNANHNHYYNVNWTQSLSYHLQQNIPVIKYISITGFTYM